MSDEQRKAGAHAALVESWKPFFLAEYQRDQRNARRQPFDEYWRWITTFLLVGGSGYDGWLAQTATALARVRDEGMKQHLGARAAQLGQRIAAEWSKESAFRKVFSNPFQGRPNLLDWGRKIQRAARDEHGDGRALEAALSGIESELDIALRG